MDVLNGKDGKEIRWWSYEKPTLLTVLNKVTEEFPGEYLECMKVIPAIACMYVQTGKYERKLISNKSRWYYLDQPTLMEILSAKGEKYPDVRIGDIVLIFGYMAIEISPK